MATRKIRTNPNQISYVDARSRCWGDLVATNLYLSKSHNEPLAQPGNNGLIIGFRLQGAIKSEYKLSEDPWRKTLCCADEFMLIPEQSSLQWRWESICDERTPLQTIMLCLDKKQIEQTALESGEVEPNTIELLHAVNQSDPLIKQLVTNIYAEADNDDPLSQLYIDALKQQLTIHLLRNYFVVKYKVREPRKGLSSKQVQHIRDYIYANLHQSISLKELAELVNISEYHFSRLFKQATGKSPYQYVLACKMDKAKNLLLSRNISIKQVAIAVGYSSESHFNKAFKKFCGANPVEYRTISRSV